jgi:hypothetical protein
MIGGITGWRDEGFILDSSPDSSPALADCVNRFCPWSGEAVKADALTRYGGEVVGFCNAGCRDKFERAVDVFDAAVADRRP